MSDSKAEPVFDRAIALLQDFENDQLVWLLRRAAAGPADAEDASDQTNAWELPWAERLEKESYREALARELDWQFGLDRKKDFIVCATPRLNLVVHPERMEVISREEAVDLGGFGMLEVYPIQLYGRRARGILSESEAVRFYSAGQLEAQADSLAFTPQTECLMKWLEVPRS